MEIKQSFFLRGEQVRLNAMEFIRTLPIDEKNPLVVSIKLMRRSLEQNAKLHAMLSDIAKQCEFQGKNGMLIRGKRFLFRRIKLQRAVMRKWRLG